MLRFVFLVKLGHIISRGVKMKWKLVHRNGFELPEPISPQYSDDDEIKEGMSWEASGGAGFLAQNDDLGYPIYIWVKNKDNCNH